MEIDFYFKIAMKNDSYYKNALELIFIIKMQLK